MKFSPKSLTLFLLSTALVVVVLGIAFGGFYQILRNKFIPLQTLSSQTQNQETPLPESTPAAAVGSAVVASLPESFPADFPVYTGGEVEGSWQSESDKALGISVIWKVAGAEVVEVVEFYQQALTKADWETTSTFKQEDAVTLTIKKDETEGFIGIAKENDQVTISVTLGLPKNEP